MTRGLPLIVADGYHRILRHLLFRRECVNSMPNGYQRCMSLKEAADMPLRFYRRVSLIPGLRLLPNEPRARAVEHAHGDAGQQCVL